MTITVELSPAVEAELKSCAARGDGEAVRQLLLSALAPAVETLMGAAPPPLSVEEFEAIADELADILEANKVPPLSDYAVSREGLYEDHL